MIKIDRTKPVERADVIAMINPIPEQDVGDYRESIRQKEYYVIPPNWDSPGDSIPLIEFTFKQEYDDMIELQRQLIDQRKHEQAKNDKRTEAMYKMQALLRKGFVKTNNFIRECVEKKQNANRTVDEQKKLTRRLQRDILRKSQEETILRFFKDDLLMTVDAYKHYEIIIREVVAMSDIYESPKDCIARCDALMLAQVEISELKEFKLRDIERMHNNMTNLTKHAALTIMSIRIELDEMDRLYRTALNNCRKWEDILANAKNVKVNTDHEKIFTIEGLNTIYNLLCARRGGHKKKVKTVEAMMDDMYREIRMLQEVISEVETQAGSDAIDISNVYC